MDVWIYVEGGSKGENAVACRNGFRSLFQKLGLSKLPNVVACGSRTTAYDKFRIAMVNEPDRVNLILVDSEDALVKPQKGERNPKWRHVREREGDGWESPNGASDDHLYFMVMATEAWLLSDKSALAKFYKKGFEPKSLPKGQLETINRNELVTHLKKATQGCHVDYKKRHAFDILAQIDPLVLAERCPSAAEFIAAVRRVVG